MQRPVSFAGVGFELLEAGKVRFNRLGLRPKLLEIKHARTPHGETGRIPDRSPGGSVQNRNTG